jgi:hypothetical protein
MIVVLQYLYAFAWIFVFLWTLRWLWRFLFGRIYAFRANFQHRDEIRRK